MYHFITTLEVLVREIFIKSGMCKHYKCKTKKDAYILNCICSIGFYFES